MDSRAILNLNIVIGSKQCKAHTSSDSLSLSQDVRLTEDEVNTTIGKKSKIDSLIDKLPDASRIARLSVLDHSHHPHSKEKGHC